MLLYASSFSCSTTLPFDWYRSSTTQDHRGRAQGCTVNNVPWYSLLQILLKLPLEGSLSSLACLDPGSGPGTKYRCGCRRLFSISISCRCLTCHARSSLAEHRCHVLGSWGLSMPSFQASFCCSVAYDQSGVSQPGSYQGGWCLKMGIILAGCSHLGYLFRFVSRDSARDIVRDRSFPSSARSCAWCKLLASQRRCPPPLEREHCGDGRQGQQETHRRCWMSVCCPRTCSRIATPWWAPRWSISGARTTAHGY